MKKSSILKFISIVIVILLLGTNIYMYGFDNLQRVNPDLDYYLGIFKGLLQDLSVCLILLFVSNSLKSFKKYNLLNYISVLATVLLLLSKVLINMSRYFYKIQNFFLKIYMAHGLLETIVTCLIIISLLVFNQNRKEAIDAKD